jgi:very-short-patch-repair endonuclease
VYRLGGAPEGHLQRLWAAHLAVGAYSVVSHEAAAGLLHLSGFQRGLLVVTLDHPEHARVRSVTVHQITDLDRRWVWSLDGLPVTTSARTLVDLAATCGRARLERTFEDGLTSGRITRAATASCLFQVMRPGKRGLEKLASILDKHGPGRTPPASELERLLFTAISDAQLPAPRRQFPLPGRQATTGRVDAAYVDARLILEADGRRWHTRRADFARDRQRDNEAARAGWQTLRFTWEELHDDPTDVGATISEVRSQRLALLRGNT